MSTRQKVADLISEEWADIPELSNVRVIATEDNLDDIQVPTCQVRFRSVERGSAQGIRDYTFLVILMSQFAHVDSAADELDDLIPVLRDWLDTTNIRSGQTRIVAAGNRLAAETEIIVPTSKEN